jgi:hypothetical protein
MDYVERLLTCQDRSPVRACAKQVLFLAGYDATLDPGQIWNWDRKQETGCPRARPGMRSGQPFF